LLTGHPAIAAALVNHLSHVLQTAFPDEIVLTQVLPLPHIDCLKAFPVLECECRLIFPFISKSFLERRGKLSETSGYTAFCVFSRRQFASTDHSGKARCSQF
jgi:hypothetical protein